MEDYTLIEVVVNGMFGYKEGTSIYFLAPNEQSKYSAGRLNTPFIYQHLKEICGVIGDDELGGLIHHLLAYKIGTNERLRDIEDHLLENLKRTQK